MQGSGQGAALDLRNCDAAWSSVMRDVLCPCLCLGARRNGRGVKTIVSSGTHRLLFSVSVRFISWQQVCDRPEGIFTQNPIDL